MKRLGQLIDRADPRLRGKPNEPRRRSRREQAMLDTLDLLLPADMARETDVRTRPSGEVLVLVGSPAVLERVRALLPVLEQSGRAAIDDTSGFAVSCAAVSCTAAPGIVREVTTDAPRRPPNAPASLGPVPPGPDVTRVAGVISNSAVKAAFERWMASGLESRRRDRLA